jgi:hypothetical protein
MSHFSCKVSFRTHHRYEKSFSICLKKDFSKIIKYKWCGTILINSTVFYDPKFRLSPRNKIDQFSEESAEEETDSISSSTLKTAGENNGGGGHRPKKITAKSPSRALVNGGGIVAAGKPKAGVPRKGSWHSHISPYRRSDEVANGGNGAVTAS